MTRNRHRIPTGEEFDKQVTPKDSKDPKGILRFFRLAKKVSLKEGVAEGKRVVPAPRADEQFIQGEPRGALPAQPPKDGGQKSPAHGGTPKAARANDLAAEVKPPRPSGSSRGSASKQIPRPLGMSPLGSPKGEVRPQPTPSRRITVSPEIQKRREAAAKEASRGEPEWKASWSEHLSMDEMHKKIGAPEQYGDDL